MHSQRPQAARRRLLIVASLLGLAILVFMPNASRAPTCLAEAKGGKKKCACPVSEKEKVAIPCSSVVDSSSCGVCSVVSASGQRDGRTCITLP